MKHIKEINEFFYFEDGKGGTGRLIIVEGTEPFAPGIQDIIDRMEESGELSIVDMSACDEAEIKNAVASQVEKILFVNGDDCDRAIRYAVMDLHPEIILATEMTEKDLITQ